MRHISIGYPPDTIETNGPEHSPALRSPLELELGLLDALLLSSELNYFGSDAFDQMEGWMPAFSDFVRGSLDLALGPRGRAKKALDLCLFRGMDQSKGSAAIDTYPINQKYNRSRPKLMQLWNSVQIESFLASSRLAVSRRKR
ncbi:hypothetical protein H5410_039989 [Solanum commersonii]|uniref:Uncharacterized protein n=1 Tax=Solanum commersonii TaxID=4109 RepID=A0A9J5XMK3_SOLCO|nr:hypothetical protein H5410_039989 [Solanum commersonii]